MIPFVMVTRFGAKKPCIGAQMLLLEATPILGHARTGEWSTYSEWFKRGSTKFGSLRSVVAVATCCCLCRLIDVFRSEVAACCARRNKGRLEVISSMYWPTRYLLAWIYCQPMCLSFRNCLTVVTNKKKKNVVRVFVGLLLLCNMVKIMLKHWREHKALLPTK